MKLINVHEQNTRGLISEYLARIFFLRNGFDILLADTHAKHYDFIVFRDKEYSKVQVKTAIERGEYLRVVNRRGKGVPYDADDYDLLVAVHQDSNRLWVFSSENVTGENLCESIALERLDGAPWQNTRSRPQPDYISNII